MKDRDIKTGRRRSRDRDVLIQRHRYNRMTKEMRERCLRSPRRENANQGGGVYLHTDPGRLHKSTG
jgi:hypothetical protein